MYKIRENDTSFTYNPVSNLTPLNVCFNQPPIAKCDTSRPYYTCRHTSAGSIFDISKYRDTCESSIPIFSGIAILRYFCIERPLFDTFDISIPSIFRYLTSSPFDDVDSMRSRRRNIVVDDDVVYGTALRSLN